MWNLKQQSICVHQLSDLKRCLSAARSSPHPFTSGCRILGKLLSKKGCKVVAPWLRSYSKAKVAETHQLMVIRSKDSFTLWSHLESVKVCSRGMNLISKVIHCIQPTLDKFCFLSLSFFILLHSFSRWIRRFLRQIWWKMVVPSRYWVFSGQPENHVT